MHLHLHSIGRYLNHLDAKVNKSPLTPEEDQIIIKVGAYAINARDETKCALFKKLKQDVD